MEKKQKIKFALIAFVSIIVCYYLFSAVYHHFAKLTLYGNVDIRDVNVGFRVSGRLQELTVDEGDEVHRGDLLGRLDPAPYERQLAATDATVRQQKAALAYADTVFAREKKLFGTGASSKDQYENAVYAHDSASANLAKALAEFSEAKLHLQDTYLYAPSDGVVLTRAVEPGTMLQIGATVLTISLINPVWVRAYVSEPELSRAKSGVKVKVYSDSNPDNAYDGQIGFVSSTAEFTPKTVETTDLRTELVYRLRIVVQDPKHELRQGMPVTVKFES